MSEALKTPEPQEQNATPTEEATSPQVEKKTPGKRTRLSFIERAQKESEELVKNMGGSLEIEGGRRTRSSARGTPTRVAVETPPPAKKSRNTSASPKATTPRGRGRGRKIDTSVTPEPPESKVDETEKQEEKEETAKEQSAAEEKPKAEDAKTNESSETNGPKKSETEEVTKAPEKSEDPKSLESTDEKTEAAQTSEKEEVPSKKENKTVDQVDATVLETVKEQKSQEIEEIEEKTESKTAEKPIPESVVSAPVDSPMDVDEQTHATIQNKEVEEVVEKPKTSASNVVEATPVVEKTKEPTPEPMEIDSSSKSSDVIECIDIVDKAEAIAPVSNANKSTNSHTENKPTEVLSSTPQQQPPTLAVPPQVQENNLSGEINANVNDVKTNDIPAVKSIEEPVSVGEPHIDNNKNENDVDQQKLAAASQVNVPAVASGGDVSPAAVPTSL